MTYRKLLLIIVVLGIGSQLNASAESKKKEKNKYLLMCTSTGLLRDGTTVTDTADLNLYEDPDGLYWLSVIRGSQVWGSSTFGDERVLVGRVKINSANIGKFCQNTIRQKNDIDKNKLDLTFQIQDSTEWDDHLKIGAHLDMALDGNEFPFTDFNCAIEKEFFAKSKDCTPPELSQNSNNKTDIYPEVTKEKPKEKPKKPESSRGKRHKSN